MPLPRPRRRDGPLVVRDGAPWRRRPSAPTWPSGPTALPIHPPRARAARYTGSRGSRRCWAVAQPRSSRSGAGRRDLHRHRTHGERPHLSTLAALGIGVLVVMLAGRRPLPRDERPMTHAGARKARSSARYAAGREAPSHGSRTVNVVGRAGPGRDLHAAAVRLDDGPHDEEPEAEPVVAGMAGVAAAERLEDRAHGFGQDRRARRSPRRRGRRSAPGPHGRAPARPPGRAGARSTRGSRAPAGAGPDPRPRRSPSQLSSTAPAPRRSAPPRRPDGRPRADRSGAARAGCRPRRALG